MEAKKRGTENTVQKESELTKDERVDKFTGDSSTCLGDGESRWDGRESELGKEQKGPYKNKQMKGKGKGKGKGSSCKN